MARTCSRAHRSHTQVGPRCGSFSSIQLIGASGTVVPHSEQLTLVGGVAIPNGRTPAAQHEAPATGKLLPVTGAPADANDWVGTVEVRAGAATREVPPRPVRAARWTAPLPLAGLRVPDELAADVRRRAGFPVSGRERDLRSTNSFHASEDWPPGSIRAETAWCPCGVAVGVVRQRVCALH